MGFNDWPARIHGNMDNDTIVLDDEDDDDGADSVCFVDYVDLEDYQKPSHKSHNVQSHVQTTFSNTPAAPVPSSINSNTESVISPATRISPSPNTQRKPGQAKLESQTLADQIAANNRKQRSKLLLQRVERALIPQPHKNLEDLVSRLAPAPPTLSVIGSEDPIVKEGERGLSSKIKGDKEQVLDLAGTSGKHVFSQSKGVRELPGPVSRIEFQVHDKSRSPNIRDITRTSEDSAKEYDGSSQSTAHKEKSPKASNELPGRRNPIASTTTFACTKCDKGHTSRRGLQYHVEVHPECGLIPSHNPIHRLHSCKGCGKVWTTIRSLQEHRANFPNCGGTNSPSLPRFLCRGCSKHYESSRSLRRHWSNHPHCLAKDHKSDKAVTLESSKIGAPKSPSKRLPGLGAQLPVINPNGKRTIDQIPLGSLYRPDQIVSKTGLERDKRQKRREKIERRHERAALNSSNSENLPVEIEFSNATRDNEHSGPEGHESSSTLSGTLHCPFASESDDERVELVLQKLEAFTGRWSFTSDDTLVDTGQSTNTNGKSPSDRGSRANTSQASLPKESLKARDGITNPSKASVDQREASGPIQALWDAHQEQLSQEGTEIEQVIRVQARFIPDTEISAKIPAQSIEAGVEPVNHPMIGGKTVSAATLAQWDSSSHEDDTEKDAITRPELLFQYFVSRRILTVDQVSHDEEYGATQILGPFCNLAEANTVASKKARPGPDDDMDQPHHTESKGWSYFYKEDGYGMQTHAAEVAGLRIDTWVSRGGSSISVIPLHGPAIDNQAELPPRNSRIRLSQSAFVIPIIVYTVNESFRVTTLQGATEPDKFDFSLQNHGAFTILDMANKKAADIFIEATCGSPAEGTAEELEKQEFAMQWRKQVKEMKENEVLFDQEVIYPEGGLTKIWVTKMMVQGPRN